MYNVEVWYISGVHTGWRISTGSGQNKTYVEGFPFNMYIEGSKEKAETAAIKRCNELNKELETING